MSFRMEQDLEPFADSAGSRFFATIPPGLAAYLISHSKIRLAKGRGSIQVGLISLRNI
jgi:hypothetical protein